MNSVPTRPCEVDKSMTLQESKIIQESFFSKGLFNEFVPITPGIAPIRLIYLNMKIIQPLVAIGYSFLPDGLNVLDAGRHLLAKPSGSVFSNGIIFFYPHASKVFVAL